MGLFDSYFDPEQFQDSGGLLGRLLSLQQEQGQYQSGPGFNVEPDSASVPKEPAAMPMPVQRPTLPQTPDERPRQTVAVGDYQMPQFGSADASQVVQQPGIGDRLNAGFQSWAHTPVGNPFAALANGVSGFSSGERTDPVGIAASRSSQTPAQALDLGDRFSSGFQSWARTPVGNPFAALASGVSGFSSGQRSDPTAVAQRILRSPTDAIGDPQSDLHARYQALRPLLGDENAMLAIVHPEVGKSLIAQALDGPTKPGSIGKADQTGSDQPSLGNETNSTAVNPSGPASTVAAGSPQGHTARGAQGRGTALRSNMPRALVRSALDTGPHRTRASAVANSNLYPYEPRKGVPRCTMLMCRGAKSCLTMFMVCSIVSCVPKCGQSRCRPGSLTAVNAKSIVISIAGFLRALRAPEKGKRPRLVFGISFCNSQSLSSVPSHLLLGARTLCVLRCQTPRKQVTSTLSPIVGEMSRVRWRCGATDRCCVSTARFIPLTISCWPMASNRGVLQWFAAPAELLTLSLRLPTCFWRERRPSSSTIIALASAPTISSWRH